MQIGPSEGVGDTTISKYVEQKKATEDERNGNLESHYGYARPFTSSPTEEELEDLDKILRDRWKGDLPKVLDPTAGGGVIPFESLRYGLPTKANELNPIPSVILRVLLEYAPDVGKLENELQKWGEAINSKAKENLQEYFPSSGEGRVPDSYVSTYRIRCQSCGADIPLIPKWWIRTRRSADKVLAKPELDEDGKINYQCIIDPSDSELNGFDPDNGPVSTGGSAECLNCEVVTEADEVKRKLREGDFEYDTYCVRYQDASGQYGFRAPSEEDRKAIERAKDEISSDYELSQILSVERHIGPADRAAPYGITEWRDAFAPRQLLSHFYIMSSFEDAKDNIKDKYSVQTAEAIISLLALSCTQL
jgi:adenine-specific DNA methylase